jgi:hypothetical protein
MALSSEKHSLDLAAPSSSTGLLIIMEELLTHLIDPLLLQALSHGSYFKLSNLCENMVVSHSILQVKNQGQVPWVLITVC